jgi:hypothetical protein
VLASLPAAPAERSLQAEPRLASAPPVAGRPVVDRCEAAARVSRLHRAAPVWLLAASAAQALPAQSPPASTPSAETLSAEAQSVAVRTAAAARISHLHRAVRIASPAFPLRTDRLQAA